VRAAKRHPDIGGSIGGIAGGAKRFADDEGSVAIMPFASSGSTGRVGGSDKRFADEPVSPGVAGSAAGDVVINPWPFGW